MQHGSNPSSQAHFVVGRAAEVGYLEQCLQSLRWRATGSVCQWGTGNRQDHDR